MKLTIAEKRIFVGAFVLFVICILLTLDERFLFQYGTRDFKDLIPIGKLVRSSKEVRRKTVNDFFWSPLEMLTQIYQEDTIFTGNKAWAEISFQDNDKLLIEPNSLIVIHRDKDQISLILRKGKVRTNLKKTRMTIRDDTGKTLPTSPTSETSDVVQISALPEKIQIIIPDVTFEENVPQKKVEKIFPALTVGLAERPPKVVKLPLKSPPSLISPKSSRKIYLLASKEADVLFVWADVNGFKRFTFQVARNQDFSALVESVQISGNQVTLRLRPGEYYWRVKNSNSPWSEVFAFSILPLGGVVID